LQIQQVRILAVYTCTRPCTSRVHGRVRAVHMAVYKAVNVREHGRVNVDGRVHTRPAYTCMHSTRAAGIHVAIPTTAIPTT